MARREINIFSVSFLDCIFCGFGAVVLLFVIINARVTVQNVKQAKDLSAEVKRLQRDVLSGKKDLILTRNTLEDKDDDRVRTEGLADQVEKTLEEKKIELARFEEQTLSSKDHVNRLKADLQSLEKDYKRLKAAALEEEAGSKVKTFRGDGDRQYLTGVKMGGKRILLLVDASASMLGRRVVDVIIRRNLPESTRRESPKWKSAVKTVDWLTAQFPPQSQFQVVLFNTGARPLISESRGRWLDSADPAVLGKVMSTLHEVVPEKGTSLHAAFAAIKTMDPRPDNLFLLTDGLPTMAEKEAGTRKVSGKTRLRYFRSALRMLHPGVPVNVILFPMEGDPMAASSFWRLAVDTKGSFFSPSEDWP